jgi:hypothetical protein
MQGQEKRRDAEKERYWRRVIGEAARSGVSIRQFCRDRRTERTFFDGKDQIGV